MAKKGATQAQQGNTRKARDVERAAFMKKNPGQFPNSVSRPWSGCGSNVRIMAMRMGTGYKGQYSAAYERGMVGGVLAERLGYGSAFEN